MNYEIVKELKDAGFIFKSYPEYKADLLLERYEEAIHFGTGELFCVPTLSELITACGNDLLQLHHYLDTKEWLAVSGNEIYERASTPEEAVARLWLALNKK